MPGTRYHVYYRVVGREVDAEPVAAQASLHILTAGNAPPPGSGEPTGRPRRQPCAR